MMTNDDDNDDRDEDYIEERNGPLGWQYEVLVNLSRQIFCSWCFELSRFRILFCQDFLPYVRRILLYIGNDSYMQLMGHNGSQGETFKKDQGTVDFFLERRISFPPESVEICTAYNNMHALIYINRNCELMDQSCGMKLIRISLAQAHICTRLKGNFKVPPNIIL